MALLSGAPQPAHAQSFFQKLFGSGNDNRRTGPPPSLRSFGRTSSYGLGGWFDDYSYPSRPAGDPSLYRTLCVRMCDGYYWPISSGATRSKFYDDAKQCQSSCETEARLFYLPRLSDDVEHMTDLTGRAYGRLSTAFAYRKALVNGCTCKAPPWSPSEIARHESYAGRNTAEVGTPYAPSGPDVMRNDMSEPQEPRPEQTAELTEPVTGDEALAADVPTADELRERAAKRAAALPARRASSGNSVWSPAPPPEFHPFAIP